MIRALAAALLSAMTVTACGGRGVVPPESGISGPSSEMYPGKKVTNPCYTSAVQPAWIFMGSCLITKLTSKGGTFRLKPYKGITVTATLPKNNLVHAETFVLVDALGTTDVSKYKGLTFPKVPKLKSVIYVETVNSEGGIKFTAGDLVFEVTSTAALPGKTCPLSVLEQKGTKFEWDTTPIQAKVKDKTLSFIIPATDTGLFFPNGLPKGPLYFNAGCT